MKLQSKLLLNYSVLLFSSLLLSSFIYSRIYSDLIFRKTSTVAAQTLTAIETNFHSIISSIHDYSIMIIINKQVRDQLISHKGYENIEESKDILTFLTSIVQTSTLIRSIYLFDNDGNKYESNELEGKALLMDLKEAPWYDEVVKRDGGYILRKNSEGLLSVSNQSNFISLIQQVNDIESQKSIGMLIINISEDSILESFRNIRSVSNISLAILDNDNSVFSSTKDFKVDDYLPLFEGNKNHVLYKQEKRGSESLISSHKISGIGWKIISMIPFSESSSESYLFKIVTLIIIAANTFLIFIGSIYISNSISKPISRLTNSMNRVKSGEFSMVEIIVDVEEISQLRNCYNIMIGEIQTLIKKVIEKESIQRKIELNALQSQIKPHFLYNSFDAVSSLALSGDNQDVYKLVKALGSFYRKSLSRGKETIDLKDEIAIAKNYLTIQSFRYQDMFDIEYEITEIDLDIKIIKLILQPLLENAIYHGIRPANRKGLIRLTIKTNKEYLTLEVADNGIGMDNQIIEKILDVRERNKTSSFGLRQTIERLEIFYNISDSFTVKSKKEHGTIISIKIPLDRIDNDNRDIKTTYY